MTSAGTLTTMAGEIDTSVPSIARMYDYWLGGTDNFPADREAARLSELAQDAGGQIAYHVAKRTRQGRRPSLYLLWPTSLCASGHKRCDHLSSCLRALRPAVRHLDPTRCRGDRAGQAVLGVRGATTTAGPQHRGDNLITSSYHAF